MHSSWKFKVTFCSNRATHPDTHLEKSQSDWQKKISEHVGHYEEMLNNAAISFMNWNRFWQILGLLKYITIWQSSASSNWRNDQEQHYREFTISNKIPGNSSLYERAECSHSLGHWNYSWNVFESGGLFASSNWRNYHEQGYHNKYWIISIHNIKYCTLCFNKHPWSLFQPFSLILDHHCDFKLYSKIFCHYCISRLRLLYPLKLTNVCVCLNLQGLSVYDSSR